MKKSYVFLVVVLALIAGVIVVDQMTTTKPEWPVGRVGDASPTRPQPNDPPFHRVPIAETFEERRQMYFDWLLEQETPDSKGGVWVDIGKLAAGADSISPTSFQAALDFVNERKDPSDFYMTALVRLYYLFSGTGKLTAEQETAIREAMLNAKYWLDEPNTSYVEMWTENHQILNHANEYLAGQLFPDETFSNNGETGQWRMEHARAKILEWIDLRARTGFAEWDSETYYPEDLGALFNLADFAEDDEIARQATMLIDLILFDIAVDSFYGQYATSHGRVTTSSIQSAAGGSVTTLAALAWGQGRFSSAGNMGVIGLATSPGYSVPPVIQSLALDNPDEYYNFERHSFPLEEAETYGLDKTDVNDAPRFWGMGAFTHPDLIDLTIQAADEWELWHYPDFRALKDIARLLQATHTLSPASSLFDPDPNGILMTEVNKMTYRTPDYMLSSAQDFRKGEKGYQQHIWQATLSPYAVVFATNPDSLRADDKHRPSYWMSNGRMPRTAQYRNTLISLFDIDSRPSAPPPLEARHYAFTHAYFPKWAFDEVVEVQAEQGGGWIFGRAGEGYVGLYSHLPYEWQTEGPDAEQEVIALGYQNVWITQLGRESVDGEFTDFVETVSQCPLDIDGLKVDFGSPGNGLIAFAWDGALQVDGESVSLRDYPRWDNCYTQTDFDVLQFLIEFGEESLSLDFEKNVRQVE